MKVKAILRKLQCSPKKVRLVADQVRGLSLDKATNALLFLNKKSSQPVLKLLNSAIANAENNFKLKREDLVIQEIKVDGDGMYKRFTPKARGVATPILKRLSRIELTLEAPDKEDVKIKKVEEKKDETVKAEPEKKSVEKKEVSTKAKASSAKTKKAKK